uniref:CSON004157 protein n=1 Tax=Culicoides sonorensis TaxID=179676 RepID=A0A336MNF1_CULSO
MKFLLIVTIFQIITLYEHVSSHCLYRNPSNPNCSIQENLADEKWLQELCDKNLTQSKDLTIISVLNNEFKSGRKFEDFCKVGAIGRLSWINYTKIIEPLLNSKTVNMDLARMSRVSKNNATYLHNNEHVLDEAIATEVLVENLPLRYELRNIERTHWENITKLEVLKLEEIYFRNEDSKSKIIAKYPDILTNRSIEHVFPDFVIPGTEMRLYQDEQVERIVVGQPKPMQQVRVKDMSIRKRISPNSHTTVRIEGTLANVWFEFTGDLTLVYDGFKEEQQIKGRVIENKVIDIKQIHSTMSKIIVLYDDGVKNEDPEARYRAFKIVAIIACIIFFGTCIVVWTDVIIKLIRARREKRKGATHSPQPYEKVY